MTTPRKGEASKDFLNRCIPETLDDGITRKDGKKQDVDKDQAVAICYSILRSKRKTPKKQ